MKVRAYTNSATATPYLLCGLFFVILRQNRPIFDHFCGLIIFGKADISSSFQTALIIKKKMLYKIPTNRILYNIFRQNPFVYPIPVYCRIINLNFIRSEKSFNAPYLKKAFVYVIFFVITFLGLVKNMKIQESAENYLEMILMLRKRKGYVRSIDIANELGFSKPSVSVAMKNFKENGYITVDDGGMISLTEKGQQIAEKIYERHTLLTEWLTKLGVSPETAAEDACRMEHVISEESFSAIKKHAQQSLEK